MLQIPGVSDHAIAVFTTREGGTSLPPYFSNNLGLHVGDDEAAVLANRAAALAALGYSLDDLVVAEQVHGSLVARVGEGDRGRGARRREDAVPQSDALITDRPGVVLAAWFADCAPILAVDPEHRAIGLAHAGWRGTVARIGSRLVDAMARAFGSRPDKIVAAIGPCIGPCHYEVDEAVMEPLRQAFPDTWTSLVAGMSGGRGRLDLRAANAQDLLEAGLRPHRIHVMDMCTACDTSRYYSHRAEGARTGRMGAILALNP